MCRIAGIIDKQKKSNQLGEDVKSMCDAIAHGGPDDFGLSTIGEDAVFGHRRLAIIDLTTAGHQPMSYSNLTITYNGEIYNYKGIKAELIKLKYIFSTETDTEVILIGFKAWGTDLFSKLEGMFAFALYDHEDKITYLVRDESGIKPLYYCAQNSMLTFASEVKAFAKTSYSFTEDKNWKTYFLAFGHIPQPFTTLKDVFSLKGGNYLQWEHLNHTYQILDFATQSKTKTIKTEAEATVQIATELKSAVDKHLIADAPIGVFLSGGIDSSIITLLANESIQENLKTLSINFAEEAFSEEKYQNLIRNKVEGKHASYRVTEQDFADNFSLILEAMDQPTNDGINSWFVNKCAKENGLKAVLSGIGADELFGGYPSFKRMKIIERLKKLPKSVLRLSAKLPSEKLKRIYYLSYKNPIGEYLFLRGFFNPAVIAKVLNITQNEIDKLFESFPIDESVNDLTGEERASWFETNMFMKNQLLKDTDFMSMSHGVEVRVPFLAQSFLNTTHQIENNIRFKKQQKGLLINAFKNILPEAIWNRPKMGFTFPLQQWFKNGNQLATANYNTEASKLMQKFKNGKLHWSKAFALYQVFKLTCHPIAIGSERSEACLPDRQESLT